MTSADSFRRALGQPEFGRHFLDGLVVAGAVAIASAAIASAVVASAVIAFPAGTAVTRFRLPFRTTLPTMFPRARMVPREALASLLFLPVRDFAIRMRRGFGKAFPEAPEGSRVPRRGEPYALSAADPFPARPAGSGGPERDFPRLRANGFLFAKSFIGGGPGSGVPRTRTATPGLRAGRSGKGPS